MVIGYLIALVLVALALTRVPAAVRGRNLTVVLAALAVAVAFTLITPAVYDALATVVPVPNLVDLVAKLALFTGLLLAGTQVARAYDAPVTQRRIAGLPGLAVFTGVFVAEVVVFALVHTVHVAPDLADDLGNPLVRVYSTLATAYPAWIAWLLLPHIRTGLRSRETSARTTSVLLVVGFGLALVRFLMGLVTLVLPAVYPAGQVVSGIAAVAVAAGLATAFFARLGRQRRRRAQYS